MQSLEDFIKGMLTPLISLPKTNAIFSFFGIKSCNQSLFDVCSIEYIVYRDNSLANPDNIASINNQTNMIIATCSFTF